MGSKLTAAETKIARIARAQHGVVTRKQLLDAGLSGKVVDRRIARGLLYKQHRGIYRAGHEAPSTLARYMAAVLACGPSAALSCRAASHLWRLLKAAPSMPEVAAATKRRNPGVRCHEGLDPRDITTCRGIPVTTVARTLVGLAAILGPEDLARACHEAEVRHRTTPAQVEAVLARLPNACGAATLRAVLRGDVKVTLSKLERRFLEMLRESGLPLPATNRPAGRRRVDCRWPEHPFRRYMWSDVFENPESMLRELRYVLVAKARRPRRDRAQAQPTAPPRRVTEVPRASCYKGQPGGRGPLPGTQDAQRRGRAGRRLPAVWGRPRTARPGGES